VLVVAAAGPMLTPCLRGALGTSAFQVFSKVKPLNSAAAEELSAPVFEPTISTPRFACLSRLLKNFGGHLESVKLLRLPEKAGVGGSTPSRATILFNNLPHIVTARRSATSASSGPYCDQPKNPWALESVRLNFLAPAFHRSRDRDIAAETTFDCAARLLAGARGARQLAFLSGRESQFHCRRCWAFPAWNMSPHWDTACGRSPRA
jgi:hypothetical protein